MPQTAGLTQVNGTASVTNVSATAAIIAAQGANKVMRITKGVVAVTLAATGGSGVVNLQDGSTVIMKWDANAVGAYPFDFGDIGYPLSANSAFNLTVTTAVTNQASATCAATAVVA